MYIRFAVAALVIGTSLYLLVELANCQFSGTLTPTRAGKEGMERGQCSKSLFNGSFLTMTHREFHDHSCTMLHFMLSSSCGFQDMNGYILSNGY